MREDPIIRYAVYQRPEGGKVVFKGRQDSMEAWARVAWTFERTAMNKAVHWSWMITGSLSAVTSVVCMVNMRGYLQLAYLGILSISSIFDILVTIIARAIQLRAIRYGDNRIIRSSDNKWTSSVIRAALEVEDRWSLQDLPWIELGLLPDTELWTNFCELLPQLRNLGHPMARAAIYDRLSQNIPPGLESIIDMLADGIEKAQLLKQSLLEKSDTHVSVAATTSRSPMGPGR